MIYELYIFLALILLFKALIFIFALKATINIHELGHIIGALLSDAKNISLEKKGFFKVATKYTGTTEKQDIAILLLGVTFGFMFLIGVCAAIVNISPLIACLLIIVYVLGIRDDLKQIKKLVAKNKSSDIYTG
jgi:hypothetical protein